MPIAFSAWFLLGVFEETPLAWLPSQGFIRDSLVVFGAAGIGYVWFWLIAAPLTVAVWVIFGVSGTLVRQDWIAGFLGGATAVMATLPLWPDAADKPLDLVLGPLLAILLAQLPTTYVATRKLKQYVRESFWSADDQVLVDRKSMNLQISLAALFGVMTVSSLAMGLMRASGLLEQPVSRLLLAGIALEVVLLPLSVWASHRLLGPPQPIKEPPEL